MELVTVSFVFAMIATVVLVDIFLFRHHFSQYLMADIGIVLVFAVFFLTFVNHH